MKTLKLISLFVLAFLFSHCGTTEPTTNVPTGNSVLQVARILDTIHGKFYELAQSNLSSTPGEVLVMTADWAKTQPDVLDAYWFDSTYIEIKMKSGLRTTFMLFREGTDGTALTRGGTPTTTQTNLQQTTKSKNVITNKKVLIYAPFVSGVRPELADLYKDGELDRLINLIKTSGKDMEVIYHDYSYATLKDVESFGDYGLVILSTHGLPDAFITGEFLVYDPTIDTSEKLIKEQMDYTLGPGGYEKVSQGDLRFCHGENIPYIVNWQQFLKEEGSSRFRVIVNAGYIDKLPSMPNTIILGNMCYSGWSATGEYKSGTRGKFVVENPIKTAFTNRGLISYYSYGYADGTSDPSDNNFCKKMEDSIIRALIIDGDSTGNAYLNSAGNEYTAGQLGEKISPTMPLKHFGHKDYSYEGCVKEFTDERDGQKYKAVCIGKQNWMAENLRYVAPGSECYDSAAANCATFGRLYPWRAAMAGSASSNTVPSGVQGICPKGWHLPSAAEWEELFTFLGGKNVAGNKMKLKSPLWKSFSGEDNSSGFTGIPGGLFSWNWSIGQGDFKKHSLKGEVALFLSSTLIDGKAQGFSLQHMSQTIVPFNSATNEKDPYQPPLNASCRCVKD